MHNYLAIDLGAESGRTIVGSLEGDLLSLNETHRFSNETLHMPDGLHWDVSNLWTEIKIGIGTSSVKFDKKIDSLGLDAWGVDFALLDKKGSLLFDPFHYRDARTDGMMEQAFKRMPAAEIFNYTGLQFMPINTLYQLLAMVLKKSDWLDKAEKFLTIPDLFNYWLCSEITNEFTCATTTQCFNPRKNDWADSIFQAMEIPGWLFGPVTAPGIPVGTLTPTIASEIGAGAIRVVLPACHDTGSAVAAVPAQNQDFAWISSGTWSIMGAEVDTPHIDEKVLQYNFSNEGGVFGTWRLSKNITGLWLVQECRREWALHERALSYDEMIHLAEESEPFISIIDPDFEGFMRPGDMPSRIQKYCLNTHQVVPQTRGQILRIAFEGIALKYRFVLDKLEELTEKQLDPIHIIGGGAKNRLLNQFTANATNRMVFAGPVEATGIGNIMMQAVGLKHLTTLAEARNIVRTSFSPEVFEPQNTKRWDEAYFRLGKVMK